MSGSLQLFKTPYICFISASVFSPTEIRNRYLRLRKRCGHKKAIIAIARMLLTALYNMLKNKEPYNAELYRKSDVLPVNREITIEQAILMAQFQGYKIKSATE